MRILHFFFTNPKHTANRAPDQTANDPIPSLVQDARIGVQDARMVDSPPYSVLAASYLRRRADLPKKQCQHSIYMTGAVNHFTQLNQTCRITPPLKQPNGSAICRDSTLMSRCKFLNHFGFLTISIDQSSYFLNYVPHLGAGIRNEGRASAVGKRTRQQDR